MNPFTHLARVLLPHSVRLLGILGLCLGPAALAQTGHTLIAEYPFSTSVYFSAQDTSGNNNNINGGSSWGGTGNTQFSTNGIAGGGSLLLDGGEAVSDSSPPPDQTFDNLLATFYGSFSVSVWINTTNRVGNNSDDLNGNNGATIIWAYNSVNGTIPIALTGSKVAFFTGDPTGNNGDTLHSTASVTTGSFVNVVVTWDALTGQKTIYINGVLDSSDTVATNNLDGNNNYYSIGGVYSSSYAGLLDDVQFYSGVLSPSDVAYLHANPGTPVADVTAASTGPVAFYDFDEGTDLAADLTDNGNNLIYGGVFGGPVLSSDSITGGGAVYFNGGGFLTPATNLLSTLAGNFSLSVWVKTTQFSSYDGEPAYYGDGIVSADIPGLANDLIPLAITGGGVGFNTGGSSDVTLNSATDINDGNYHHLVVTRNEATGLKQIYVDGNLSSSQTAYSGLLNAPALLTIGALADASQTDPTSPETSGHQGYVGLLDDIQFYSRVLTPAEVSGLHAVPGSSVTSGLVCHYDFDEGTVLASDVSGHGNNMVFAGSLMYNAPGPTVTNTAESGPGAVSFGGNQYLVPEGNLTSIMASNFSLSVWLQTTQSLGTAGGPADKGAGIVTAQIAGQSYDLTPLALTGGKVAFDTDGYFDDLLTSSASINDGNYHHVVVTRDQTTGQKQIYIDGNFDSADTGDTALLNNPAILILGAFSDAGNPGPNSPSIQATNGYVGLMDQLQFYPRVISSDEVAYLYNNPGATLAGAPTSSGPPLNTALGTNFIWSTSGNVAWFVETTNTYYTNAAAAQSGSLQDGQSSILQTTVTGPGNLTFLWETIAGNDDFDLEFDVDGTESFDISGQTSWQEPLTYLGPGTHTLTWNANTLGGTGSSPTDAGFVDQVIFTPAVAPVITANPFSQTNYPGYPVGLSVQATGVPAPTWQWYKVGNSSPIPGAVTNLYIPANSGTAGVAGQYYAVAGNEVGIQMTATATVTFVSAALPPDWSGAFKSPFANFNNNGTYVSHDEYYACVVDSTGTNIYSTGISGGTNYFGALGILNVNPAKNAAILVKQTAANNALWVLAITNEGNGNAYGEDIAPAPAGGVYVAFGFSGTNWLGNTRLADSGVGSILLAKFDANGNELWGQIITSTNGVFSPLHCLASDPAGNVTLAGVASTNVNLGGTNVTMTSQTSFLGQFNANGVLNWAEHSPNIIEYVQSSGGRVYVSLLNYISGDAGYNLGGLVNPLTRDYTLAAVNATNGAGIWITGIAGPPGNGPTGGIIDDYPEISVAGTNLFLVGTSYGSNAVFGAFTLPMPANRGQYFARYDTNGNAELATTFGSATTQPQNSVADAAGNVYVAGDFDTYAAFGNYVLSAPREATYDSISGDFSQAFAAKFDRSGNVQWARMGVSTNQNANGSDLVNLYDLALAPNALWVGGVGNYAVYFGTNLVNSAGQYVAVGQDVLFNSFDSGMLATIPLAVPLLPVTLINPIHSGTNFDFSFISTATHTNYVEYTTNLVNAVWYPYSTIPGDGTLKTVIVPANHPAAEFFRVSTQ
jgi:hypothetical protein